MTFQNLCHHFTDTHFGISFFLCVFFLFQRLIDETKCLSFFSVELSHDLLLNLKKKDEKKEEEQTSERKKKKSLSFGNENRKKCSHTH